ncbi:TPA: dihydropteroate synthase, partial [bacterium]|nr:dihydropteroate synthase [bacterium]
GESTRPGSQPISVEEEKRRIIPVVERLLEEVDLPISVDTYKSEVAKDCLRLGAHMINDISALRFDPEMKEVVAASKAAVVLMHIKGRPQDMQENPHYDDLIEEITGYFKEAIKTAKEEGIEKERIVIDPGIGFGKTVAHNLEIMKGLDKFKSLGYPILIGPSRKSVIGKVLDLSVDQRLEGTAACVATCILNGASLIRVHDVKEMVKVAKMCDAIKRGEDYCPS